MSDDRTARFRALHDTGRPLFLPNAWDFASAAALLDAGFPAIGTTSMGVTAAHGLPDAQALGRDETVALAGRLTRLPCPVSVDVEAGFGDDPGEVAELAAELADLGVAGINLEDGRPGGALADPAVHGALVRAVKERVPDLFVNARVDTHWLRTDPPPALDGTLERAARYAAAGADGIFVPGLSVDEHVAEVVAAVPLPVNLLFDPRRDTLDRLGALGVRRVSTGSLLFRSSVHAAVTTARAIRDGTAVTGGIPGYVETQRLIETAADPR